MDDEAVVRRWVAGARRAFIGRERELEIVRANLGDEVPPTMIFAVTGEPGVGKTTLLRRLRAEVRSAAVTAWVDGPAYHPLTVIRRLGAELRRYVDTHELDEALADEALAARRHGLLPLVPGAEHRHRRAAVDRLSPLLIDAIDRTIAGGPMVVLFLDDLGWPDHEVGHWLVDVMGGVYGQFPPEFLVVIAGDASCTAPLVRYPFAVTSLGLTRFTPDETEQLLAARHLPVERAAAVQVDSGGLPAFVDLLAHPWLGGRTRSGRGDAPDPIAHLVGSLPDRDLARALLLTSVPRWTEEHLPDAVYRGGRRQALAAWLRAAPASTGPRRHVPGRHWHPAVREAFLGHLRAHEPRRLLAAHGRLARHHERRWLELAPAGAAARWHRAEIDYHEVAAAADPLAVAGGVVARVLAHGPAAVPSVVAVDQALGERGLAEPAHRGLVAALAADDVVGVVELAGALGVGRPGSPPAAHRSLAVARWATGADPDQAASAAVAWHEGRFDDAERRTTEQLAVSPDDAWLLAIRGDVRLRRRDAAGAYDDLRLAAVLAPGADGIQGRLGIAALGRGDAAGAVGPLGAALLGEPDPILAALRGEALRRLGDLGAAAADLDWSVRADGRSPWVHRLRARVALAAGDAPAAVEHLRRAVALAPGNAAALAECAEARRCAGDRHRALGDLTQALSLVGPRDADERSSLLGPADAATEYAGSYDGIVTDTVERHALHLQRAVLLEELVDLDAARAALDDAVRAGERRPEVHEASARFLARRGDLPGAVSAVDRWIDLDPSSAAAHAERGRLCLTLGDARCAVEALSRAIEIEPDTPAYRALRGAGRRALGDGDGTIGDHTAAIGMGFDEYWLRGQRSEAYLAEGDLDAAMADLQVALRQRPEEPWLLELHGRLVAASCVADEPPMASAGE